MPKATDSVIFSEIEQEILETALRNPELSNSEIADRTGARLTLVRDTRRSYEDEVELSEAAADAAEDAAATPPPGIDAADLSQTQVAILEVLEAEPDLSNAELADRTGARMALVRDTRAEYGEAVTTAESGTGDDADADTDDTDAADAEPSETQAAILESAAAEPDLSNAELADRTGARITLVRDTLREFDIEDVAATDRSTTDESTTDESTTDEPATADTTPEIDTEAFSETQIDIIEAALDDPESTNADIAARTGTRITLVRDTIRAYESDGDGTDTGTETDHTGTDSETDHTGTDSETESDADGTDVLADVDTEAFSETQLDVLETALQEPALSNAEIADRTDTRIALVRDTLFDYEYDEKPWAGEPDEADDDADDETASEPSTPTSEEPELPETTASDLLSPAERAILETALQEPELTNAEIAARTDTRLTLVRDTRRNYEAAVDLAAPTDDSETSGDADATGASATDEPELPETTDSELLSPAERAILETALQEPELTNAAIADRTDTRITLVRDTRRAYEAAVDLADDGESAAAETDETAEAAETTETTEIDETAETTETAEPAASTGGSEGGSNTGLLIALLVGLLLVIVLAVTLL